MKNNAELILKQPDYWVEAINGALYNAIVDYMDENDLNRTQLAKHLGISSGRVSQILNDGQLNYSIKKMVELALKVGKFPVLEFTDSDVYLNELEAARRETRFTLHHFSAYSQELYEYSGFNNLHKESGYSNTVINQKITVG